MNTITPFIVFSVELSKYSNEHNAALTSVLYYFLKQEYIDFIKTIGCFNGIKENSVIITYTPENEKLVQRITRDSHQDCYLVVDANRQGHLYRPDGKYIESLGPYVSESTKPDGLDYTYIPETNTYFYF